MSLCETCGVMVSIGDWPFCPHGPTRFSVRSDSIRGGQVIENLGPEPIRVYSETERRRIMRERGLIDAPPRAGRWSTATAKMLQDGADLVSAERRQRGTPPAAVPDATLETLTITTRIREDGFVVAEEGEPVYVERLPQP